jgi:hypothetical protein
MLKISKTPVIVADESEITDQGLYHVTGNDRLVLMVFEDGRLRVHGWVSRENFKAQDSETSFIDQWFHDQQISEPDPVPEPVDEEQT